MIGYWGEFEFEVSENLIFTFDGFGRKASINIEEQETEGKKPSTYIKGEGLEEISLNINLKYELGVNVKDELDRLRKAMYSKTPHTFVIADSPLSQNKWLLTSVDESEPVITATGQYISAKVALSFKEYVRGGSKKDNVTSGSGKGTAKSSTKSKGATSGGVIDKLEGTRYNSNATSSLQNGPSSTKTYAVFNNPLLKNSSSNLNAADSFRTLRA